MLGPSRSGSYAKGNRITIAETAMGHAAVVALQMSFRQIAN